MTRYGFLYLLSALFLITSCDTTIQTNTGPSAEEIAQKLENDRSAIQAIISGYDTAIESKDSAACAAMFADNGVFMANESQALKGADILAWYESLNNATDELSFDFDVQETSIHHDWAYAWTNNSGSITSLDGEVNELSSKSFYLFARQGDGSWKVKLYMFNSVEDDDDEEEEEDESNES